ELPQQSFCKQEVLIQQTDCRLDREEPEPPQTQEEQENLCSTQDVEQLVLKEESDSFVETSTSEGNERDWFPFQNPEGPVQEGFKAGQTHPTFRSDLVPEGRCGAGGKLFFCSFCGKEFKQRKKLTQHIRTHTDERPYSCKWCEKSFHQSAHLIAHVRIHTGERPYACSFCDKRFKDLHTQKRHIRSHTGERPYSCQSCGERFRRRENLVVHMRTHRAATET
uniref:C2H2-type domain-containing protein n=1 Tax=Kryptolebias marmoratus TaxID=37003 RepID=A0A3Q3EXU6_KRYMA